MKNTKKDKLSSNVLKIKTGIVEEFFSSVRSVMRAADKKETIKDRVNTLIFEDPMERCLRGKGGDSQQHGKQTRFNFAIKHSRPQPADDTLSMSIENVQSSARS
jgi:hypothetical protein